MADRCTEQWACGDEGRELLKQVRTCHEGAAREDGRVGAAAVDPASTTDGPRGFGRVTYLRALVRSPVK